MFLCVFRELSLLSATSLFLLNSNVCFLGGFFQFLSLQAFNASIYIERTLSTLYKFFALTTFEFVCLLQCFSQNWNVLFVSLQKLKTRRNVVFELALFQCMWSLDWCQLVCMKLKAYIFLYLHSLSTRRFDASWCSFLFGVFWFSMLCVACVAIEFFMNFVY